MKKLYKSIINAKIYECENIKIAEAANLAVGTRITVQGKPAIIE